MQQHDQLFNKAQRWFSTLSADQVFLLYELCIALEDYIWTHHEEDFIECVIKSHHELKYHEDI